jgi:membrane protein implicated in regulation of membrane protease activity
VEWLENLQAHWAWLTLGLVLAGAEMLLPGVYLIWLALAAIATGALTAVLDLSLPYQVLDFVCFALIFAFSARRFLRDQPIESVDPLMNQRGARLIGETAVVVQAIENGSGRVKLGDSEWLVHGPDIAAGARVRVKGVEGATLLVEPFNLLPGDGAQPSP